MDIDDNPNNIRYIKESFRFLEFGKRYYHKEVIVGATSVPLRLPINERNTIVSIDTDGSALIQYTLSTDEAIVDNSAIWHDWPEGAVTGKFVDAAQGSITALKLVSVGTTTWEVAV
jgi:hypothetical protein